jgi:hypothetical protein
MKINSALPVFGTMAVVIIFTSTQLRAEEEPYKFYEQLTESMRAEMKEKILAQCKVIPREKGLELVGTLKWTWKKELTKLEDPKKYFEKLGSQDVAGDVEKLKDEDKNALRKTFELARLSYDTFIEYYKVTDDEIAKSYDTYLQKGLPKW